MSKLVKDPGRQISCFLSRNAFDSDVRKELSRIKRYGHRASFMLIKLHISHDTARGYDTYLYQEIKKQLRDCDSVYFFDTGMFSAILPDTPEGGGECAALRLKRNISHITDSSGEKIASSIGLVSAGQESSQDLYSLLSALERDLDRDNTCQMLPQKNTIMVRKKVDLKSPKQDKAAKRYTDVLSAIGSATHQLNQPLQIIIGKIELMLLDLESGNLEPGEIKKILAQIRKQVLYAADINQKINRLTKV